MSEDEITGEHVGKRLRTVAELLFDGNKSDLARAMEMKPSSFGKYLRGTRRPGASVLERLTHLGISIDWLLTGEGAILRESAPSLPNASTGSAGSTSERPTVRNPSMNAADLSGPDPQFYPVPTVKPRLVDGDLALDQVGDPEWIGADTIRTQYGVAPDRLCTFVISSSRMLPTIRPGERVRGVLSESTTPLDELSDGSIYLTHSTKDVLVGRLYKQPGDDHKRSEEASQRNGSANLSSGPAGNEQVLLSGDNPDVADRSISAEEWSCDFSVIAELREVIRPL